MDLFIPLRFADDSKSSLVGSGLLKKDLSTIILKVEVRALGKIRRIGVYEMAIYSRIDPRTY